MIEPGQPSECVSTASQGATIAAGAIVNRPAEIFAIENVERISRGGGEVDDANEFPGSMTLAPLDASRHLPPPSHPRGQHQHDTGPAERQKRPGGFQRGTEQRG